MVCIVRVCTASFFDSCTIKTILASSPPLNVMAYNTSSTSIMVTWQPPQFRNGIIRGYQVNYTVSGGAGTTSVMNTNVTNSTLLTGLSINKEYIIYVRAMTVTLGISSSMVMISTNEDGMFHVLLYDLKYYTILYHSAWHS